MSSSSVAPDRERPTADTEGDLAMSRYADGHDASFFVIHKLLAPRLHSFLTRMTRNVALADDLLQDTFLRIHHARGSFAQGARVLPWSYAIARNVYIDYSRSAQHRNEVVASEGGSPIADTVASTSADGEAHLTAKQMASVVEQTLAAIPRNQREAFILIRYEGLSIADAAGVLGATEGAVKLRAFHAYQALRAALAEVERSDKTTAGARK